MTKLLLVVSVVGSCHGGGIGSGLGFVVGLGSKLGWWRWAGGGGLVAVGWWWNGGVGLVAALISLKSVGIVAMECHLGSRKMTGQQSTDVGW